MKKLHSRWATFTLPFLLHSVPCLLVFSFQAHAYAQDKAKAKHLESHSKARSLQRVIGTNQPGKIQGMVEMLRDKYNREIIDVRNRLRNRYVNTYPLRLLLFALNFRLDMTGLTVYP